MSSAFFSNGTIDLREDEWVDELRPGQYILQKKKGFRFGVDAVLLAAWPRLRGHEKVLEIGSGTGIVSLLLSNRYPDVRIMALELQEAYADMAKRSVSINRLQDQIEVYQGDLRDLDTWLSAESQSVVLCNPPYFPVRQKLQSPNPEKAIARHEITMDLTLLFQKVSWVLRQGGSFYFIHRPARLSEIMEELRRWKLEPKEMRLIHPHEHGEANLLLMHVRKGGGRELRVQPPLFIYQEGRYTEEILSIYREVQIVKAQEE